MTSRCPKAIKATRIFDVLQSVMCLEQDMLMKPIHFHPGFDFRVFSFLGLFTTSEQESPREKRWIHAFYRCISVRMNVRIRSEFEPCSQISLSDLLTVALPAKQFREFLYISICLLSSLTWKNGRSLFVALVVISSVVYPLGNFQGLIIISDQRKARIFANVPPYLKCKCFLSINQRLIRL